MGEIAKMMLEGVLCAGCGVFLDVDGKGCPEYCKDCQEQIIEGGSGRKQVKISYTDLAVIIESIYYGEDEDVSDIEDLLKYLRNNGHLSTVLTVSRGSSDE